MLNEELIKTLAEHCAPVRPLAHPARRALVWFFVSLCYVAVVVAAMGVRPDFFAKIADPQFATELAAAFLTSLVAAAGAFSAGCPARPIWERFAAGVFLFIWMGALAIGCLRDINAFGFAGLLSHSDIYCLPTILAISIPGALLILPMVKRGAPVAPFVTIGLAALASTALAAAALRLSFRQDAAVSVCIWQFGSVVLLTAIASLFGRVLLRWTMRDALLASFQTHRR
ncbi:MAG: DUF1109 domain-containing protein [Methylocystis sp.]